MIRALLMSAVLLSAGPGATQAAPAQAEFVTLGTAGGPMPLAGRSGPANALVVGRDVYLLDAGPGALRQLAAAGLAGHNVRAVFLTHHHVDHIADLSSFLGTLWVLGRPPALPVYGPDGTEELVSATLTALTILESVPVTLGPLPAGGGMGGSAVGRDIPYATRVVPVFADENVKVFAIDVAHFHLTGRTPQAQPRSVAYRIEAGERCFTYTGDSGPTDRLVALANGCEVLVSEVIDLAATRTMLERTLGGDKRLVDPLMEHMRKDHLPPDEIGRIAREARVSEVVLTHLVPGARGDGALQRLRAEVARHFDGRVRVAGDLDRF